MAAHEGLAKEQLLMTPEEAAQALRVGRTTVYALMKAGDLHPVHIGRSCRLPVAELERYVSGLQPCPPGQMHGPDQTDGGPTTTGRAADASTSA